MDPLAFDVRQLQWVTKTNASELVVSEHRSTDRPLSVSVPVSCQSNRSFRTMGLLKASTPRCFTSVTGPYQVGDVVSENKQGRTSERGLQWSVGCRLICFEKDKDGLGEEASTY